MLCSIIGIKKGDTANYLRVLASNKNGFEIISQINQVGNIPVITKLADFKHSDDCAIQFDIRATDIASLCSKVSQNRKASRDYITSPQIV